MFEMRGSPMQTFDRWYDIEAAAHSLLTLGDTGITNRNRQNESSILV